MNIIPLTAEASQTLRVTINQQNCFINVYQKSTGLFLDLYVDSTPIIHGQICRDRVKLVRESYLGFNGDLVFMDLDGLLDPDYTGLGSRYQLLYLAVGE